MMEPPAPTRTTPHPSANDHDRLSLWDRILGMRDRLVASDRFRDLAMRFPLTRPVARRQARALFDLCAGFVYTQVLTACVQMDLFALLAGRPLTVSALARHMDMTEEAAQRLLEAAVALKLIGRRSGGRYGLGSLGAALNGDPGIQAMVDHHRLLYDDMADPVGLLRGTGGPARLGEYWAYAGNPASDGLTAGQVADYSRLMAITQSMVRAEILAAYDFSRHDQLLDIGGGEGAFLEAVARKAPRLMLHLFDLPAVANRATERFDALGLADRLVTHGGSFLNDGLPKGADIITLVRVLFDHRDSSVQTLLGRVYDALPPGGTLLIAEPMARTPGAEPVSDAYFTFYLLAMGGGFVRSRARHQQLLEAAGFTQVRERAVPNPLIARVLTCVRPD